MTGDSKKASNKKNKSEPKEQRKPQQRQEKLVQKKVENDTQKGSENATVSGYEKNQPEPGPEFYENLKRETADIITTTEPKYNKKEIKSNWKKYDMPIPTYDAIEEHENLGEDYEQLIQASLSSGGHFQFKHEKSWTCETVPSEYDKYFEIDVENLSKALSSIPFNERNDIDISLFSEYDIANMKTRATKYKERYANDKTFIALKTTENTSKNETVKPVDSEADKSDKDTNEFQFFPRVEQINVLDSNVIYPLEKDNAQEDTIVDDIKLSEDENRLKEEEIVLPKIIEDSIETKPLIVKEVRSINDAVIEDKTESPEDLEKWLDDFLDS